MEANITMATMIAEPYPIFSIIGMPETLSPRIATITVTPAKSTERPAVALARPMAIGHRLAGGQVLAMPGEDEERVVDADAQTQHHRDDAGHFWDRDDSGHDADGAAADHDGDERRHDRQAHRDQ